MRQTIFLDESGDLGWTFDKPYGKGGSSRFITLAAIVLPENKIVHIERIVKAIYRKRKRPLKNELKSIDLNSKDKQVFVNILAKLLEQHTDIQFHAITINKKRTKTSLKKDANTLYNYAVKRMLLPTISQHEYVDFIPDARGEKTHTRWNMGEYLQQMLVEMDIEQGISNKQCNVTPMDSKHNLALQFVDFYASLVWASHEFKDDKIISFGQQDNVHHSLLFEDAGNQ